MCIITIITTTLVFLYDMFVGLLGWLITSLV